MAQNIHSRGQIIAPREQIEVAIGNGKLTPRHAEKSVLPGGNTATGAGSQAARSRKRAVFEGDGKGEPPAATSRHRPGREAYA